MSKFKGKCGFPWSYFTLCITFAPLLNNSLFPSSHYFTSTLETHYNGKKSISVPAKMDIIPGKSLLFYNISQSFDFVAIPLKAFYMVLTLKFSL